MENPTYIGDAVYAFHNGFQIELRLDDHRSPTLIFLEPEVLNNLVKFAQRYYEEQQKQPATE